MYAKLELLDKLREMGLEFYEATFADYYTMHKKDYPTLDDIECDILKMVND